MLTQLSFFFPFCEKSPFQVEKDINKSIRGHNNDRIELDDCFPSVTIMSTLRKMTFAREHVRKKQLKTVLLIKP